MPVGILHAVPLVILNVKVQIEAKVSGGEIVAACIGALLDDVADVVVGGAGDVLKSISERKDGLGTFGWMEALAAILDTEKEIRYRWRRHGYIVWNFSLGHGGRIQGEEERKGNTHMVVV